MDKDKLATFHGGNFVVGYQNFKTCLYLNDRPVHRWESARKYPESKNHKWYPLPTERTHNMLVPEVPKSPGHFCQEKIPPTACVCPHTGCFSSLCPSRIGKGPLVLLSVGVPLEAGPWVRTLWTQDSTIPPRPTPRKQP